MEICRIPMSNHSVKCTELKSPLLLSSLFFSFSFSFHILISFIFTYRFFSCLFFTYLLICKWLRILFSFFESLNLNWTKICGKNSFFFLIVVAKPSHFTKSRASNQSREREKNHYTDKHRVKEQERKSVPMNSDEH